MNTSHLHKVKKRKSEKGYKEKITLNDIYAVSECKAEPDIYIT